MDSWAKDGAFTYDKELLNLLMQTNNMKAMSRETGIPYRSIILAHRLQHTPDCKNPVALVQIVGVSRVRRHPR